MSLHPHLGQVQALQSEARIVAVISGAQGGKTSLGPVWLWQEMTDRGAGDYMVVTPTYGLMESAALPKFRSWFEDTLQLGRYIGSPSRRFVLSEDGERRLWGHRQQERTTVRFGHASDPDTLESVTLKGLWCDEAGQREFKKDSWDNLYTRRLAVHQGRALLTTTPYSVDGWLRDLCDEAASGAAHIEVIRFDSTANPAFPVESYEEARRTLPAWKFDLMFRGIFSRPAGLIYDSFIDSAAPSGHLIPRFQIPDHWKRFVGLDFGGVNTAATFLAAGQDQYAGQYLLYRTYHAGNRTASGHVTELLKNEPSARPVCYGGAKSEGQWRSEFAAAGLRIQEPPVSDVEVGIDRVYAAFRERQLLIMNDVAPLLTELRTYSRKVDESGNVTEEIDRKNTFHHLDSLRYIFSHLRHQDVTNKILRPLTQRGGGFA